MYYKIGQRVAIVKVTNTALMHLIGSTGAVVEYSPFSYYFAGIYDDYKVKLDIGGAVTGNHDNFRPIDPADDPQAVEESKELEHA